VDKDILKSYGESTAYTAKGHFKAADLRRRFNLTLIAIIMTISVLSISQLVKFALINQVLGACSLLASIFLLIFEVHDGVNNHIKHKLFAEKYLELHYDIFHAFQDNNCSEDEITRLKNRMNKLNRTERPFISSLARKAAKKAVVENQEMNVWWK
ncbi:MAG: hypothetical protein ACE5HI_15655, partial [bacterium]